MQLLSLSRARDADEARAVRPLAARWRSAVALPVDFRERALRRFGLRARRCRGGVRGGQ